MARTLAQERSSVRTLAGLVKATPDEVDDLFSQGHKELCTRGEWTRKTVDFATTVAEQAEYDPPADLYRMLWVEVNGARYDPSSETEIERIRNGDLVLAAWGLYWLSEDETGNTVVSLYPAPDTAGLAITGNYIYYPEELAEDGDPFLVPDDFVKGVRAYVKRELYSAIEDDEDRSAIHNQTFENEVTRLRQHRFSRTDRSGVRMRIEGWTA